MAEQFSMLVVDDDQLCRVILQGVLSSYGDIHFAKNGKQGLQQFQDAYEKGQPYSVVFMDLVMPEMNGWQAVLKIRELEARLNIHQKTKIVIASSKRYDKGGEILESFKEAGVDLFLEKPVASSHVDGFMMSFGYLKKG